MGRAAECDIVAGMTDAVQIPTEPMTVEKFLEWAEQQPKGRFELVRGEIVTMAPERNRHALTKLQVAVALREAVSRADLDCTVFPDGVSVIIDQSTTYEPDTTVQCGGAIDMESVKVDEPLIIVEVLSSSTGHVDISGKLVDYFRVPSIIHYLIVDADRRATIHHSRDGEDIATRIVTDGALTLDPPGLKIAVADMFIDE